ncbi:unnamed protein product [[Candida] boidinii]|nr:unnamed protein product [[Candida] boidinii]
MPSPNHITVPEDDGINQLKQSDSMMKEINEIGLNIKDLDINMNISSDNVANPYIPHSNNKVNINGNKVSQLPANQDITREDLSLNEFDHEEEEEDIDDGISLEIGSIKPNAEKIHFNIIYLKCILN